MEIVVTDGFTLNPGDLSWKTIENLGALTVYDRTPPGLIVERCRHATIVLTNKVPFSSAVMQQLPRLKLISVLATGYNVIEVQAAKESGIVVCNVPAYGTASVAQHTFALLLELTNRVGLHAQAVAAGAWQQSADWCFAKTPLIELAGKTMGIAGLGSIGQQTATLARAFGMRVLYYTPSNKESSLGTATGLHTLFAQSDVVSLHCPLTKDNQQFVNKQLLSLMKPSAFFINTARGQLIQEDDLAQALNEEMIAGAALDVLSTEPPTENNPLLRAKNCIITPHNAWMSREARERILKITAHNILAFQNGTPQNVVNP